MTTKFEYTDPQGVLREAEAFTVVDYTATAKPNSPIITRPDGTVDPSIIPPGVGTNPIYEQHFLTEEEVLNKKIMLSKIPIFGSIRFVPEGALPQRNNLDFRYDDADNSITWSGLGLDGYLEVDELIEIFYMSNT